ncbi:hypothetical protein RB653_003845 [Dictyostelium firmibasis]|uniref:Large ribosomal subunit protein mL53 n=1 Tax=Dictyostelium firmibasis TaxID=79012 RepID=A0AAN7YZH2_9MYCE
MREKLNLLSKLKSIVYKFDPMDPKTRSIRSFIPLTTCKRTRQLAPECKISFDLSPQNSTPEINIKFVSGLEKSIKTETLELDSIVESIELLKKGMRIEEIEKMKSVETTLQDILQPVNKKKDTGAKANR